MREPFQNRINKQPTIIINNTFINRPGTEQNEFLTKFSPTFCNKNAIVQSIRDMIPSVTDIETFTEGRHDRSKESSYEDIHAKILTDIKDMNELNKSFSRDKNIPVGAIITAVLWIILILFWFLLYLKVLNVYNPSTKNNIPKPQPTNYELCLMFFRKFGIVFGRLWQF